MKPHTWTLTLDQCGRPLTQNQAHRMHYRDVARVRRRWHDTAAWLARRRRIPALPAITVAAYGRYGTRRSLPDPDALAPTLKAVIDGIVAAGVIPDDTSTHVRSVTYLPPVVASGQADGLVVTITEVVA